MRTISKIRHYIRKNPPSIGAFFLIFMNIVVLVTILFMMAYFMRVSKTLTDQSFEEKTATSKAIANIFYGISKDALENNNTALLQSTAQKFISNGLINFVIIYDTADNNKIIWSSMLNLNGKNFSEKLVKEQYKKNFPYNNHSNLTLETNKLLKTKNIVIAYTLYSNLLHTIEINAQKNPTLAVIFLLISSFYALLMVKLFTAPINSMTESIKIFASGNYKHKMPTTYYKELNILIRAFNEMAGMIYKTHNYLEEQIKDRTRQISEKNRKLNITLEELKQTQAMLVHGEKMRSLGELVAGITHEINNPINFIYGNLTYLNNYSNDLMLIIDKYKECTDLLPEDKKEEVLKLLEDKEYDYIKEDLPELIKSCTEGTVRTKNIVLDLKNFSRTDKMVINEIDMNKEIDTTLNILYNKYKNRITIHKEYGEISTLDCYGGQLNQVLMNIIDNAIFAIKDAGDIYIRTKDDGNNIIVEIEDNGSGIAKENIEKVFEPFFTTKGVGEGTGLGMSITYKIVETHGGNIDIDSELGKGTKFTITLPKDGLKKQHQQNKE